MAIFSPVPIRERYAKTTLRREGDANVLINLPKKGDRELSYAAKALSSHKCRECASCCASGFSFTKKDPHFEQIMAGIRADRKRFVLRKEGILGKDKRFQVFVPHAKRACGFLEGQEQVYSELHFMEPLSLEGGVFGCKIYAHRPSICISYPFIWDVFDDAHWVKGKDNSFVALDPKCCAMWELATRGVGHFTLPELNALIERAEKGEESMLSSIGVSLAEIKRRVSENGSWGKIFRTEDGEEVYPLNFNELSHPD